MFNFRLERLVVPRKVPDESGDSIPDKGPCAMISEPGPCNSRDYSAYCSRHDDGPYNMDRAGPSTRPDAGPYGMDEAGPSTRPDARCEVVWEQSE
jgi:hypothetical protein